MCEAIGDAQTILWRWSYIIAETCLDVGDLPKSLALSYQEELWIVDLGENLQRQSK